MARRSKHPSPPLTRDEEAEARASRRVRAAEEPLDVRVRSTEPYVELEVRNPLHQTSYRVFFPTYPSRDAALCTCADFARRGLGTCKHLEAADAWLGRHPTLEPAPRSGGPDATAVWREVDHRSAGRARDGPRDIRELEAVGRALIDPATEEKKERVGGEGVGRPADEGSRPTSTSRGRP